jgi:acetyltransferase-like isoleucine patch superfamily enzyme
MGFGINSLVKNFSVHRIFLQLKRLKQSFQLRKKHVSISLGCNISNSDFGNNIFLGENVSLINSNIGDFSYINNNSSIKNTSIGKFCSIGPNVQIILGKHPANFVSSHPAFYAKNKPFKTFSDKTYIDEYDSTIIGNDVWIAEGVLIPSGVTIGNGAIITARSVVTKDVEPYSIVGGVPAKHIKYRFDESSIEKLNNSKWWDWDTKQLEEKFRLFHDPNKFIQFLSDNYPLINNEL